MIAYFHFDLAHFREHGGHYVDAVFTFQLVLGVPLFQLPLQTQTRTWWVWSRNNAALSTYIHSYQRHLVKSLQLLHSTY